MKQKFKKIIVNQDSFTISYFTEVTEKELDISQGKILICIIYEPKDIMTLDEASEKLKQHLDSNLFRPYVKAIIQDNKNFYNQFKQEREFSIFGSSGGNWLEKSKANYASASITFTKI